MKRADVETLVPLLVDKLQSGFLKRGAQPELVNALFAVPLAPLFELLRSLQLAAPDKLKERYQNSVNQLAKVDPLLAYQLSGRPQTDFNEIVDTFVSRATELEDSKVRTASAADFVSRMTNFIKSYGQRNIFANMEADIIDVARKISYLTEFRTRRRLRHLTVQMSEHAEQYVDSFLDLLIQFAAQSTTPLDTPTGP